MGVNVAVWEDDGLVDGDAVPVGLGVAVAVTDALCVGEAVPVAGADGAGEADPDGSELGWGDGSGENCTTGVGSADAAH